MDGIFNALKMEEITGQFDPAEIEQQKGISIVSLFLCFLFFLPIVSNNNSEYAKMVANQALTMLVLFIALSVVSGIVTFIPLLGTLISFVIWVAEAALIILKVVDAANGKLRTLPFGIVIPAFK